MWRGKGGEANRGSGGRCKRGGKKEEWQERGLKRTMGEVGGVRDEAKGEEDGQVGARNGPGPNRLVRCHTQAQRWDRRQQLFQLL